MPNPVNLYRLMAAHKLLRKAKSPRSQAEIAEKMRRGETFDFIGSTGDETLGGSGLYNTSRYRRHTTRWTQFNEEQKMAVKILEDSLQKLNPHWKASTTKMHAREMISGLRRYTEGSPFQPDAEIANNISKRIAAVVEKARDVEAWRYAGGDVAKLGTAGAVAKMSEATMMPEGSFGTKVGNLLIDVLSPVPRYK